MDGFQYAQRIHLGNQQILNRGFPADGGNAEGKGRQMMAYRSAGQRLAGLGGNGLERIRRGGYLTVKASYSQLPVRGETQNRLLAGQARGDYFRL
ncbi:hypothetical protein KRX52_01745 [Pseudomonas sp. MAP12]|uniref:Uncharacterized protein n=1 Tax=Geopseudomonas aromaticivorans TaxID=2849492 RepID=A0ABS6MT55_9GAMM|nr:hypothetical protein [Pseudomonas aromaticivorans]MBV2131516.1 hypothetical protein [Pseudomonas aromaticivorans]